MNIEDIERDLKCIRDDLKNIRADLSDEVLRVWLESLTEQVVAFGKAVHETGQREAEEKELKG
jgi:hypothetical protein